MSWDVRFSTAGSTMGTKASVREQFLSACEQIVGAPIPRQGPTEVVIDDAFQYETLFIGNKHVTESLCLSINVLEGDPQSDQSHPVWVFIRQIINHTGWQAEDTHRGEPIS